jgi:hypothetical protein
MEAKTSVAARKRLPKESSGHEPLERERGDSEQNPRDPQERLECPFGNALIVKAHIGESSSNGWRLAWALVACEVARRIREVRWNFICSTVRPQTLWLPFLFLIAATVCESAQTEYIPPAVETIVARMAKARLENHARFRPYTVTRDYKLFGKERQKTKAQVIADVTFVPPTSKNYAIQQTNGTGLGERIVRQMLASEVKIAKDYSATDYSTGNYNFRFIREEEINSRPCYVLEMMPKRKDKNLLRGNLWVDANTYLLRRAEGEPAKTPSWWVRNARVALFYGDVGGMWLQTALEGSATVRILGPFTIVSSDVKYEIGDDVSDASASRNKSIRRMGIEPVLLWPGRAGLTQERIVSGRYGDKARLGREQEKGVFRLKPVQRLRQSLE